MNTMKTLLAAAILAAGTQAHAIYQEPIPLPIPEIETGGGDDTAAIILGVGILAFIKAVNENDFQYPVIGKLLGINKTGNE